jgi:hypothetical protein
LECSTFSFDFWGKAVVSGEMVICKIKMAKNAPPEGAVSEQGTAVSESENAFRLAGRRGGEARRFLFRTVSGGFLTAFLALRLLV